MSYTLTIDAPEAAVSFATGNGTRTSEELGSLFVAFLIEKFGYEAGEGNPFAQFCGIWSEEQFSEFQNATRRVVNAEDWQ